MREPPSPSLSRVLRDLIRGASGPLSVGELIAAFGERSFGAAIVLFAAPNLIPLPPGSSAVFGLPLLFITAQLMIGRHAIWLPRKVAAYQLEAKTLNAIIGKILPVLKKVERLLKPRGGLLVSTPMERLAGAACFLLSVILFLPIPLANIPPALALCCFALGLIGQDWVFMLAGWATAAATAVLLYLVGDAAVSAALSLLNSFNLGL